MENERYLVRIEASMSLDVDLYRGGNAKVPRLENVRDKDIVKYKDPDTGLTKVKGMSGGVSTFSCPKPEKNWYWIKAGTVVPSKLTFTRDRTDPSTQITHYTIRPSQDMLFSEYIEQMQKITNIEKLTLEQAIALAERWVHK
jgi:hypothetical protein